MKKLMAANWKMYKTVNEGVDTARELAALLDGKLPDDREVLVCPSFTMLHAVAAVLNGAAGCSAGAQNFYPAGQGAFTGEIAPEQLLDLGCAYALAGHSERRHVMGETDEMVGRKVTFGMEAGLKMILCVGETIEERRAGQVEAVLARQLELGLAGVLDKATAKNLAVAYEPVWAIGTGEVAGPSFNSSKSSLYRILIIIRHFNPPYTCIRYNYYITDFEYIQLKQKFQKTKKIANSELLVYY